MTLIIINWIIINNRILIILNSYLMKIIKLKGKVINMKVFKISPSKIKSKLLMKVINRIKIKKIVHYQIFIVKTVNNVKII